MFKAQFQNRCSQSRSVELSEKKSENSQKRAAEQNMFFVLQLSLQTSHSTLLQSGFRYSVKYPLRY